MQEMAALTKQLKQRHVGAQIYSYAGTVGRELIDFAGTDAEGVRAVYYTVPVEANEPAVQEYRDAFAKYEPNGRPDYISLLTFAMTKITVEALRRADEPLNRTTLAEAFYKLKDYDTGILPPVSYSPEHHLGASTVQRVQVVQGKWTQVGTPVAVRGDW